MSEESCICLTAEQHAVLETLKTAFDSHEPRRAILVTGPAGTGKTEILKAFLRWLTFSRKLCARRICLVAPTGTAAINMGGSTIHSAFRIDPQFDYSEIDLSDIASATDEMSNVIIIDEISMVSNRLFTHIHQLCGGFDAQGRIFGGRLVLMFGDFMQLAPVAKKPIKEFESEQYYVWKGKRITSSFCFQCEAWEQGVQVLSLTENMRQNTDPEFSAALAELRLGCVSRDTARLLIKLTRLKGFEILPWEQDRVLPTVLYGANQRVQEINTRFFRELKSPVHTVHGVMTWRNDRGQEVKVDERRAEKITSNFCESLGVARSYDIRVGAQVMCRINIKSLNLVNGSRGIVESITTDDNGKVVCVFLLCDDGRIVPLPYFAIRRRLYAKFFRDAHELVFTTIPLCLAWSMTIHKAQAMHVNRKGATLSSAVLSLKRSDIFLNHQAYVGISRVKTRSGLYLTDIDLDVFRTELSALAFYTNNSTTDRRHVLLDSPLYDFDEYAQKNFEFDQNTRLFELGCKKPIHISSPTLYAIYDDERDLVGVESVNAMTVSLDNYDTAIEAGVRFVFADFFDTVCSVRLVVPNYERNELRVRLHQRTSGRKSSVSFCFAKDVTWYQLILTGMTTKDFDSIEFFSNHTMFVYFEK